MRKQIAAAGLLAVALAAGPASAASMTYVVTGIVDSADPYFNSCSEAPCSTVPVWPGDTISAAVTWDWDASPWPINVVPSVWLTVAGAPGGGVESPNSPFQSLSNDDGLYVWGILENNPYPGGTLGGGNGLMSLSFRLVDDAHFPWTSTMLQIPTDLSAFEFNQFDVAYGVVSNIPLYISGHIASIHLASTECSNGADDDGDGVADANDPGCLDGVDYDENEPSLACDDGVDNDADGNADYPDDPGCRNLTASPENPQCKDGLNNDNAAGIDFDGGASRDLDQNGFIDAQFNPATPAVGTADPQCTAAWMNRESAAPSAGGCGVGPELAALLPLLAALRRARRRL